MGARTQSEPSSLTLALIGLVAGALLVGVMTVLGIGPFSDDAEASEGSASFVVVAETTEVAAPTTTEAPQATTSTTVADTTTTTEVPETTTTVADTTTTQVPETTTTQPPATTAAPATTQPPPPPPPTTTTTIAPTGQAYLTSIRSSTIDQGPAWVAVVTVRIGEAGGANIAGAAVSGSWSTGGVTGSCTTDGSGSCTLFQSTLTDADPSTTFVVTSVSAPGYTYAGALTGGSQITVNQP